MPIIMINTIINLMEENYMNFIEALKSENIENIRQFPKSDGITILEIGEDVWGLSEFFNNDIEHLIYAFQESNERIAPEIELRLQRCHKFSCRKKYQT